MGAEEGVDRKNIPTRKRKLRIQEAKLRKDGDIKQTRGADRRRRYTNKFIVAAVACHELAALTTTAREPLKDGL